MRVEPVHLRLKILKLVDFLLHLEHCVEFIDVPQNRPQGNGIQTHGHNACDLPEEGPDASEHDQAWALTFPDHIDDSDEHVAVHVHEEHAAHDAQNHPLVEVRMLNVITHESRLRPHVVHPSADVPVRDRRAPAAESTADSLPLWLYDHEPLQYNTQGLQDSFRRVVFEVVRSKILQLVAQIALRRQPQSPVHGAIPLDLWLVVEAPVAEVESRRGVIGEDRETAAEPEFWVCVRCLSADRATNSRENLHHALLLHPVEGVGKEAGRRRQRDQLLEVLHGRLTELVKVASHHFNQPVVHARCRGIGPLSLDLLEDRPHAIDVLFDLVVEVGGKHAGHFLSLAIGPRKYIGALALELAEVLLLLQAELIAVLVVIRERHGRVLEHEQQDDAPHELVNAGVLPEAFLGPRRLGEARELKDVYEPRDGEEQRDAATNQEHEADPAVELKQVVQMHELKPPVHRGAESVEGQPHRAQLIPPSPPQRGGTSGAPHTKACAHPYRPSERRPLEP
mmetsp:Transcript_27308/g.75961  ORF Transcript_27308/g.75961 Transcript_27308/m.75961 type:complete len:508 (+) Transcript_27308:441-1964(+)